MYEELLKFVEKEQILGALEAIDFQPTKGLGDGLTKTFKEIMDYRDDLESRMDDNQLKNVVRKYELVMDYFKNKTFSKIQKIVKDTTGVNLTDVYVLEPPMAQGMFAILVDSSNISKMVEFREYMIGKASYSKAAQLPNVDPRDYIAKTLQLNIEKGKLEFGKIPVQTNSTLFFDFLYAFFMDEIGPNIPKDRRLTPEELSAIIMHEVGHVITHIEYLMFGCYAGIAGTMDYKSIRERMLTEPKKVFNDKLLEDNLKKSKQYLEDKEDKTSLDKFLLKGVDFCLNFLEYMKQNINKYVDNDGKIKVSKWMIILFSLFSLMVILTINYVQYAAFITSTLMYTLMHLDFKYAAKPGGSKTTMTISNTQLLERLADEFVSRQGYGAYLASGLNKMILTLGSRLGNSYSMVVPKMRKFFLVKLFAIFSDLASYQVFLQFSKDKYTNPIYEMDVYRINRILENTYAAFKDQEGLPKDFLEDQYKQIQMIKKTKKDTSFLFKVSKVFYYINEILSLRLFMPAVIQNVIDGRLTEEYKRLFDRLDALMNNELFVTSYKLRNIDKDYI